MNSNSDDRDRRIEQLEAENASLRSRPTALDWVAVVLVATGALALASLAMIAPTFAEMYGEFGTELPVSTRVAIQPAAGPLLSIVPLVLLGLSLRRSPSLVARRRYLAAGFVFIVLAGIGYWHALYAPMFALAETIR